MLLDDTIATIHEEDIEETSVTMQEFIDVLYNKQTILETRTGIQYKLGLSGALLINREPITTFPTGEAPIYLFRDNTDRYIASPLKLDTTDLAWSEDNEEDASYHKPASTSNSKILGWSFKNAKSAIPIHLDKRTMTILVVLDSTEEQSCCFLLYMPLYMYLKHTKYRGTTLCKQGLSDYEGLLETLTLPTSESLLSFRSALDAYTLFLGKALPFIYCQTTTDNYGNLLYMERNIEPDTVKIYDFKNVQRITLMNTPQMSSNSFIVAKNTYNVESGYRKHLCNLTEASRGRHWVFDLSDTPISWLDEIKTSLEYLVTAIKQEQFRDEQIGRLIIYSLMYKVAYNKSITDRLRLFIIPEDTDIGIALSTEGEYYIVSFNTFNDIDLYVDIQRFNNQKETGDSSHKYLMALSPSLSSGSSTISTDLYPVISMIQEEILQFIKQQKQ